mmetsp:Transcript_21844/g.25817  ORF Transcript_21844/g.25817 Transcript_21844/m.25817 type:complete len:575 (+) Transcript_21844:43-1767(+)
MRLSLLPISFVHLANISRSKLPNTAISKMSSPISSLAIPSSIAPKILTFYNESEPPKVVTVATGGGSQLSGWLIGTPGASASILEMNVPYLQSALTEFIGWAPQKYCSASTSEAMAKRALMRAKELWLDQNNGKFESLIGHQFLGISSTSSLISLKPKKGEHKTYVTCMTDHGYIKTYSIIFNKLLLRTRYQEDDLVSRLMLKILFEESIQSNINKNNSMMMINLTNDLKNPQNKNSNKNKKGIIEVNLRKTMIIKQNALEYNHMNIMNDDHASAGDDIDKSYVCNDIYEKENQLSEEQGDQITLTLTKYDTPLDEFLKTNQVNNNNAVEENNIDKNQPILEESSQNVLFIPFSMKDVPVEESTSTSTSTFTPGSMTFPNFKPRQKMIVYPGSFNPLHKGHEELARYSQRMFGGSEPLPFMYEIAVKNADKPTIEKEEIIKRVTQFEKAKTPVLISKTAMFSEKAKALPNSMFLIGADTAKRILDKKYYSNDENEMIVALSEIKQYNCSFLVAGRKTDDVFLTLTHILNSLSHLPKPIKDMFTEIPADDFRVDLSSSEIRKKMKQEQEAQEQTK